MAILGVLESTKKPMSVNQIAKMSGYSNRSSGLHASMSFLRARGLIEGSGDSIQITEAGAAAAPTTTRIPTGGQELVDYWVRKLDASSGKILSVLSADWVSLEEISDATGYSLKSSGLHAAMSNLKKLKLIEARNARFRLCEEMIS
jgi:DNA-binding transcriptional regulator GbsR (MarR family)